MHAQPLPSSLLLPIGCGLPIRDTHVVRRAVDGWTASVCSGPDLVGHVVARTCDDVRDAHRELLAAGRPRSPEFFTLDSLPAAVNPCPRWRPSVPLTERSRPSRASVL